MMVYPPEILKLLDFEGFNEAFEQEMPKHKTYYLAYEKVEQLYAEKFGKRKYTDYDSFRRCRYNYLKKDTK